VSNADYLIVIILWPTNSAQSSLACGVRPWAWYPRLLSNRHPCRSHLPFRETPPNDSRNSFLISTSQNWGSSLSFERR